MTLEEAIKELKLHQAIVAQGFYHKYAKAMLLGIEALKRVNADRTLPYPLTASDPLPGETEQEK